jgi:hypothetical protein
MFRFTTSRLALAIAALVVAGPALAANVSFSGFAHGSETVTATLTGPNVPLPAKNVSAGGLSTVLNGGPSFEAYCADLYQTISFGAPPYPDYSLPETTHVFTNANAYTDLGRLYATAGLVNTAVEEAAFQIAVWEIAYEATGTPYSLSSGAATFSGGTAASSGALTLASSWLAALTNGAHPSISVLDSPLHQDVIFAPVPEPSTVLLMAAGMLGLGFVSARRRAQA